MHGIPAYAVPLSYTTRSTGELCSALTLNGAARYKHDQIDKRITPNLEGAVVRTSDRMHVLVLQHTVLFVDSKVSPHRNRHKMTRISHAMLFFVESKPTAAAEHNLGRLRNIVQWRSCIPVNGALLLPHLAELSGGARDETCCDIHRFHRPPMAQHVSTGNV